MSYVRNVESITYLEVSFSVHVQCHLQSWVSSSRCVGNSGVLESASGSTGNVKRSLKLGHAEGIS